MKQFCTLTNNHILVWVKVLLWKWVFACALELIETWRMTCYNCGIQHGLRINCGEFLYISLLMIIVAVLLFRCNSMYSSERPFDILEWACLFAECTRVEQRVNSWLGEFWGCPQFHFPLEGKISARKYRSLSAVGDSLVLFASYLDFLRISLLQLLNIINVLAPSQCFKPNEHNVEKSLNPF